MCVWGVQSECVCGGFKVSGFVGGSKKWVCRGFKVSGSVGDSK